MLLSWPFEGCESFMQVFFSRFENICRFTWFKWMLYFTILAVLDRHGCGLNFLKIVCIILFDIPTIEYSEVNWVMFACYCAVPKSSSNGIGADKELVLRTLNYEYKGPKPLNTCVRVRSPSSFALVTKSNACVYSYFCVPRGLALVHAKYSYYNIVCYLAQTEIGINRNTIS